MKWSWHSHYRGTSNNPNEFEADYELEKYLAKKEGRRPIPKKDFKGRTVSTLMNETISLKPEDILQFD